MRRIVVGVVTALLTVGVTPVMASAGSGGHNSKLIDGFERAVLGMTDADQFLFDDGCVGGTSNRDPLYVSAPSTDPATTESACTVRKGVPVVVVPAALTCWDPSAKTARNDCETGWTDPAGALIDASVIVDGKPKRLTETRVSGCFTFPEGSILDTPGLTTPYYGIAKGVVLDGLKKGVHTIDVSFTYADGFAGATTFTVTVTH